MDNSIAVHFPLIYNSDHKLFMLYMYIMLLTEKCIFLYVSYTILSFFLSFTNSASGFYLFPFQPKILLLRKIPGSTVQNKVIW
jgi:hypothetical protein